jgi:ribosome-associated protein
VKLKAKAKKVSKKAVKNPRSKEAIAGRAMRKAAKDLKAIKGGKPVKSAKKPVPKAPPRRTSEPQDKLRDIAIQAMEDRQAEDIVVIDMEGKSPMADYMLVGTGRSSRQVAAIGQHLREVLQKAGVKKLRIEGLPQGDWVLVDAGDIIIHVFRPEVRKFYNIERIWGLDLPDEVRSSFIIE